MATYVTDGKGNAYERRYDPNTKTYKDYYVGPASKYNVAQGNPDTGTGYNPTSSTGATGVAGTTAKTNKTGTSVVSSSPSTVDNYIQQQKNLYKQAESSGNVQGMISAATAADKRRRELGMASENDALIAHLTSQLGNTGIGNIDVNNPDYNQLANLLGQYNQNVQGFEYEPSESREDYYSRVMADIQRQLDTLQREKEAAIEKSRSGILTEAGISNRQLEESYQQQLDELARQADEIRNAYTGAKRNIEAEKADTMPTFQSQQSQADVQAQQAAKNIIDYFKRAGLSAGGQVASELGKVATANIGRQAEIAGEQGKYVRDVEGRLAGLEEEQASGLADVERLKGQALSGMTSSKQTVIERVNDALTGLSLDQKNLLSDLADMKLSMESGIEQEYKEMTAAERAEQFNMVLQQYGVGAQSVQAVSNLIDSVNQSRLFALEEDLKRLELESMPELLKQQAKLLEQQIKKGDIDIQAARVQLKNLQEGKTAGGTDYLKYKDYYDEAIRRMEQMVKVNKPVYGSDGPHKYQIGTEEVEERKYTDKQIKDWILGLPLSNEDIAMLMSDVGL